MKPAVAFVMICLGAVFLPSCGNYSNPSTTTPTGTTSLIKHRVFVSNAFAGGGSGLLQIIDADKDLLSLNTISLGGNPGLMAEDSTKATTMVFVGGNNFIDVVSNATEAATGSIALPGPSESIAISSDGKTGYAAVPNAPISNAAPGAVEILDLVNFKISATIAVPGVRRIVLGNNGTKMLAFADQTNSMWLVDLSAKTATAVPGFDRPFTGAFSSDDTKAYILSCGAECGGTTASVTVLNVASPPTMGATVPVSAATVGFLDSSGSLFVAGSTPTGGTLQVVSTANMTATAPVAIGDGLHRLMAMGSSNKLFIGARTCTNGSECLSIYDVSAKTAVIPPVPTQNGIALVGDVTGFAPIPNRNVVYVIQAQELVIYDTTTNAPLVIPATQQPIDIVGQGVDVKALF